MKYFIVLIISALLVPVAYGQRMKPGDDKENFFRFGIKGGLNINKISGNSYKDGFNYNYLAGAFAQLNFSRTFGLQPEINFVQSSAEFSDDASDVYNDIFRGGSQKKAKLDRIEVPLLLNVNLGPSKRLKLQFGPAYNSKLKETVDSLNNPQSLYRKAEWSAIGGLWIQWPVIAMGGRYKLGLTEMNDIDNREKWRNEGFQLFLGLTF